MNYLVCVNMGQTTGPASPRLVLLHLVSSGPRSIIATGGETACGGTGFLFSMARRPLRRQPGTAGA